MHTCISFLQKFWYWVFYFTCSDFSFWFSKFLVIYHSYFAMYFQSLIKNKEQQHLQQLIESKEISDFEVLFEEHSSAFYHASQMMSDGIILPECTRQVIIKFIFRPCWLILLLLLSGLNSNKKSRGALKFFQTLRSSNISHFIHIAVFQKVDAQLWKLQV